jgi:hypothetical protein
MICQPQSLYAGMKPACSVDAGDGGRAMFCAMLELLRWPALLLLLILGSPGEASAAGAAPKATEASVKAAYLFKFATYVAWPPSAFGRPDATLTIGLIGADDVAAELSQIRAAVASTGRKFEIKVLRAGDPLAGIHILFVGPHEPARLASILASSWGQPILTVTDTRGALGAGSIINFVSIDERLRFEVSLRHAERNGIKVSVRLLNVAWRVEAYKP